MRWPYMAAQSMLVEVDDAAMKTVEQKAYSSLSEHPFGGYLDKLKVDTGFTIKDGQLTRTLVFSKPVTNPESLQQKVIVPF